jgi:small subunit ribosomal protein S16
LSVRIRLRRVGTTNNPSYRLVVIDSRTRRDGRFIDSIGYYDPAVNPPKINVQEDKALKWLGVGALPSDTVKMIFSKAGIMAKFAGIRAERKAQAAKEKKPKKK